MLTVINLIAYFLMLGMLGYYIITTLQWYSYRLERVVFHHTKPWWNYLYFLVPFITYDFVMAVTQKRYGFIVVLLYAPLFYYWWRGIDKRLVFTGRVKRFFAALALFGAFFVFALHLYSVFLPILLAWLVSAGIEKMLFGAFRRRAMKRLKSLPDLKVVGVTASYGKTSIKNFIATLLAQRYRTYATPRSVNTLGGVMKDVNEELPEEAEVYVVEMGARGEGDIAEITRFVQPHYAVVGKIGPAHIEYFKTLERIRNTKMEILQSPRLIEAWVHESARIKPTEMIHIFGPEIEEVEATLEGTCFTLEGERYCAKILGAFNAVNLAAAIHVARALGLTPDEIRAGLEKIEPVPHRLQRIDAGGKVILDDSFNGNIDGMMASFDLAATWPGRKVLITPGLVEADEALNRQVAERAEEIFDRIIVTGDLNYAIFKEIVSPEKLRHLERKSEMEQMLVEETRPGDLILFANDAPSFI
ncbi:Mur ligase family protein [Nitratifractor salsuginis]|uniref:Mur ligase middle domain protein n=1 Tax=Nitratifractor salsuginis (strain DSM 16511 / JCM 12458 / E9I37-1) TaxID=749222 RepID=E6WZR2_NITSE|nr:UDP-N-acetylmuramoyl-tripeptide--D-alanyl-D-alanine ligase [Nitratifractor salsuginis]ADV46703.1 Mur ligase middle domain protein [Nitratifractor salsuginis DSM 16511]